LKGEGGKSEGVGEDVGNDDEVENKSKRSMNGKREKRR